MSTLRIPAAVVAVLLVALGISMSPETETLAGVQARDGQATEVSNDPGASEIVDTHEEVYDAFGVAMGNLATGSFDVQIRIWNWTPDGEREELLKVLAEQGSAAAVEELGRKSEKGLIGIGKATPYPLRYARQTRIGDTRRVILITDRPIGFFEAFNDGRSLDYAYSLVELDLDDEGNGTGQMVLGASLDLDPETNELYVKAVDRGVRLNNVRKLP